MLIGCPVPEKPKARDLVAAFIRGAPRDAEGFVFYGVKASNAEAYRRAKKAGGPIYLIDNSYFDATRGQRYRVTKNRLQVDPRQHQTDGKRFEAMGLEIKPWRVVEGGVWLALEQGLDHEHIAPGHRAWLQHYVQRLRVTGHEVVYRTWGRDKKALAASLPELLAGANGLVAHTSAGAVTAALAGVLVIVSEQHALWRMVCSPDALDERRHFFGVLADHEFTTTELEDGTAWRRLHP